MGGYIGYLGITISCGLFLLFVVSVGLILHVWGRRREKKAGGAKVRVRSIPVAAPEEEPTEEPEDDQPEDEPGPSP